MKNPEVIMLEALSSPSFIAQQKAVEAAGIALRLFDEVRAMLWRLLHPKT